LALFSLQHLCACEEIFIHAAAVTIKTSLTGYGKYMNLRAQISSLPPLTEILEENNVKHTLLRAYAGDVLYTEGMPISHAYIIKEGEVDLYMIREEKRVIIDTLSAGHCFGIAPKLLLNGSRTDNAKARTYCEFYLVDANEFNGLIQQSPLLVQSLLKTFAMQISRSNEVISSRVNFQPDLIVFAELLYLVGMASTGGAKSTQKGNQSVLARPPLKTVFGHARILLGQSDVHIRDTLGKFLTQHLVQIEEDKFGGKCLVYSPNDIVSRARKLDESDTSLDKLEYEYISVDEFAAMVDLDRNTILQTLARDEVTEDLFTFRKSEVVRLLNEKGKKFFHERKKKTPEEFSDIADIIFADVSSIQIAIAQVDIGELAKVLQGITDDGIKEKIISNLPRVRRNELEMESVGIGDVDSVEAALIGLRIINDIKDKMLEKRR
jgi:CRP-like cAMP-binding protein